MKVLKTDGTVIPNDVAIAAVEGMKDLNTARLAITEWMAQEGANWAFFDRPTDLPVQRIKFDYPKQGITAATDLLLYGRYTHPETCPGLHLYNNADLTAMHHESLGMVHSNYTGELLDGSGLQPGWNRVGIQMGLLTTSPSTVEAAIKKHNYIDYLIQGYPLQVWIAPIRDYAASFLVQWILEGNEEAQEFANNRKMASSLKRREIRPAGVNAWKSMKEAREVGESVELPEEIKAVLNGQSEVIDLMEIEQPVGIGLYRGGEWITNITFDRNDPQAVLQADNLLNKEDCKYEVEVLS